MSAEWYPGKNGRPPKGARERWAQQQRSPEKAVPTNPGDRGGGGVAPAVVGDGNPPAPAKVGPGRPSLRAVLEQGGAIVPDQVIPPGAQASTTDGTTTDGKPTFLGPGWKKLSANILGDQFVSLIASQMRARGLEPAEHDDDNLQALKDTAEAVMHQFAPSLQVPWWVALPMAALFVFLDMRTSARRLDVAPAAPSVPQPPPPPAPAPTSAEVPPPAAPKAPEPAPPPILFPGRPSRFGAVVR